MNEEKEKQIQRELAMDESFIAPIEEGLPHSLNPRLKYIQAVVGQKEANTELIVKRIYSIKDHLGAKFDAGTLNQSKKELCNEFITANNVVLEHKATRSRLREKIRDCKKQNFKLECQKLSVKYDIHEYNEVKAHLEKYVGQYSMFEKFLSSVAETSERFNSVGDVLNHYATLENTREDIAVLLEEELEGINALRRQMGNLVEEKATIMKNLRNKLILLQVQRREAKDSRVYWETKVGRLKNLVEGKNEDAIVLRGACGDLYRKLCESRGHEPTIPDGDMEPQLTYITKSTTFQKEVYAIALVIKQLQQAGEYNRNWFLRDIMKGRDST